MATLVVHSRCGSIKPRAPNRSFESRLLQRRLSAGSSSRLAIPLLSAGRSLLGGRSAPGEEERRRGPHLRFTHRRTEPILLVAEGRRNAEGQAMASRSKTGRGNVTTPVFLLVPQLKLPKRLDLARDAKRAVASLPELIVENWVE